MTFDFVFRFLALPITGLVSGVVLVRELGRLFEDVRGEASVYLLEETEEKWSA